MRSAQTEKRENEQHNNDQADEVNNSVHEILHVNARVTVERASKFRSNVRFVVLSRFQTAHMQCEVAIT